MDRLFDLLEPGDGEAFTLDEWAPKLDLCEMKDALVVRAEVPTIDPKDINLTIKEGVLTIRGEKKAEKEDKDEKYFCVERTYGTFTRRVLLPVPVDEGKVGATFKERAPHRDAAEDAGGQRHGDPDQDDVTTRA
jgi:HSP20 family protein